MLATGLKSISYSLRASLNSSAGKEFACNSGDTGDSVLIPGSGRSPGVGNGNPLQCSCGSDGKASAYNAGDLGSIPGS